MHLSAVPPPVAKRPAWLGFQAIALTAARCSPNLATGDSLFKFQIMSLLSFPPLASCYPSNDHFKPQIYCICPICLWVMLCFILKSLLRIFLSLEPVLTFKPFQEIELIRPRWSPKVLITFPWIISHISLFPLSVPTARWLPKVFKWTGILFCFKTPWSHFVAFVPQSPASRESFSIQWNQKIIVCLKFK